MKKKTATQNYIKKLPDIQRRAAEKLLAEAKPFKPVPSVLKQWLIWLGLAVLVAGLSLWIIKPQDDILQKLLQLPSGSFMLLLFVGSALAAWNGIASSMPGEEPGPAAKSWMIGILVALIAIPLFFFTSDNLAGVLEHNAESGWFCFRTVVLVAIPSWVMLAWMVSRNASFHPGWTGAWLGISAFLLGTGTIQTHCTHWETTHILVNHLLPMGLFIVIPIWIGSHWLARWKK
jgi:hypothetical protein